MQRGLTVQFLHILSYPVAYSVVVLPLSVVRWMTFSEQGCGRSTVPAAATFSAVFLHGCFGFVNVVLLLTTRPTLLLFDDPRNPKRLRSRSTAGGADWDLETRASGNGRRNAHVKNSPSLASSSRDSCSGAKRATSLDSRQDALGVMTVRIGCGGIASVALPPLSRNETYSWSPQAPQACAQLAETQPQGMSTHLLTRLHSKANTSASAHPYTAAESQAAEFDDDEIAQGMGNGLDRCAYT